MTGRWFPWRMWATFIVLFAVLTAPLLLASITNQFLFAVLEVPALVAAPFVWRRMRPWVDEHPVAKYYAKVGFYRPRPGNEEDDGSDADPPER